MNKFIKFEKQFRKLKKNNVPKLTKKIEFVNNFISIRDI